MPGSGTPRRDVEEYPQGLELSFAQAGRTKLSEVTNGHLPLGAAVLLKGVVTRETVRRASQYRRDDRVMSELFTRFPRADEFEFDIDDIGLVIVQVHYPQRNTLGRVRDVFGYWLKWIEISNDEAKSDRSIHFGMVEALKRGDLLPPPVLQGQWEVHDGRHRFLAMYHVHRGSPDFRTNVYWVHDWANGVLAHLAQPNGAR